MNLFAPKSTATPDIAQGSTSAEANPLEQEAALRGTPLPLIPAPRSVEWGESPREDWVTDDPFSEVSVGINDELEHTEYALSINPRGAFITAGSEAALADARNTFAQLVHLARVQGFEGRLPSATISDAPKHAWRGLLVDPARHFLPLEDLKKLTDTIALYRFNILQLNLTDDQGWRFEVRGYPRLTEIGARRERTVEGIPSFDDTDSYSLDEHGGFYTQAELKELVAYAKDRGVTIVPQINMPGHAQAAIAAYPSLGNVPDKQLLVRETWGTSQHVLGVSDSTLQFMRDVLEQAAEVFDSPFVSIGAADVALTEWEASTEARKRREEWGYTRSSELLGHLTQHAAEVLAGKGKRLMAWDSAQLVRIPDNTVIMADGDLASAKKALSRGFQVVASPRHDLGLDRLESDGEGVGKGPALSLKDVYQAEVHPAKLPADASRLLLGVQAQVGGEYVPTPVQLQYLLFPRLAAVAEHAWGRGLGDWEGFHERALAHEPLWEHLGVESRKMLS